MSATQEKPATAGKLEKYVTDAIRAAGGKAKDLTDEQRERAESPPDGLRGKALGRHVLEGAAGGDGKPSAEEEADAAAAAKAELEQLDRRVSRDTGHTASDQRRARALAKTAGVDAPAWAATGSKPSGGSDSKSGGSRAKYPDDVREAVRAVYEIKGSKDGSPGPKQHVHVRKVVTKQVGHDPSKAEVVKASGFSSYAALRKAAKPEKKGGASREELKAIRPLAEKMGDDAFCKGRNLAAILVAWADQKG
jgi:hypothetical protein